jgi:hypothetical protein
MRNLKRLGYRLEKRRRLGVHGPGAGIWEYSLHPRAWNSSQPQLDFLPGSVRDEDSRARELGNFEASEGLEVALERMPRQVTADPNCKLCEGGGWKVVVASDGRKFAAACDCRKRKGE